MAEKTPQHIAESIIAEAAEMLDKGRRRRILKVIHPELDTEPRLMTENEAAKGLGISKTHLWRWRHGRIDEPFPFHVYEVPGGKGVRYLDSEINDYITLRTKNPQNTEDQNHEE